MIAINSLPASPVHNGAHGEAAVSGGEAGAASSNNPFDALLGMSLSLMKFEKTLTGGNAQSTLGEAEGGPANPWTLAMGLDGADFEESPGPATPLHETGISHYAQSVAGQLAFQQMQAAQAGPNAGVAVETPVDFKGHLPAEMLQAAPVVVSASNDAQGAWNLSELTRQIQQALKARQSMAAPGSAEGLELEPGAGLSNKAFDWSPSPVQDATGNTRMPQMIEQVRQISDFLAERTEGVIKVGKDGVEANLRLYPPDLGGVRVTMNVHNGTVQATFVAERAETAQLLQQHTQQFREMMGRHGLTVDQVQVTVAASAGSSSANSYYQGQSGAGHQEREEALWNRQREQEPGRQDNDPQNAWDELSD